MILYVLKCTVDHRFEAWFRNSEAFESQAASGVVSCPVCGDTGITRAPMAPMIGKSRSDKGASQSSQALAEEAKAEADAAASQAVEKAVEQAMDVVQRDPVRAEQIAVEVRRHLTELRKSVEENCDYVGDRFAEEARRMHYGETEVRGIYGEASDADAEELQEEGVTVQRIPWLPRTNS